MFQISAEFPRHKILLKFIWNLNCMIGGSNSSVAEGSGLLVYDGVVIRWAVPDVVGTDHCIFFFRVKQSKKNSWAASP
jgi:hypothetical protein